MLPQSLDLSQILAVRILEDWQQMCPRKQRWILDEAPKKDQAFDTFKKITIER